MPGVVVDGHVRHSAGATSVPALYFLGLPWQTCRGSALLGFVGADAARLDERLAGSAGAGADETALVGQDHGVHAIA